MYHFIWLYNLNTKSGVGLYVERLRSLIRDNHTCTCIKCTFHVTLVSFSKIIYAICLHSLCPREKAMSPRKVKCFESNFYFYNIYVIKSLNKSA